MATSGNELALSFPHAPGVRRRRPSRRMRARRTRASILLAAGVLVGTLLMGGSAPASRPGAPAAVVVRPGETLWEIAGRYAPDGMDVRAYIDALTRINDVAPVLHSGQRLKLPR